MTTDQRTITNPGTLHDQLVFVGGQYASDATGSPVPGAFADQVDAVAVRP